jgi:hypothetical protein
MNTDKRNKDTEVKRARKGAKLPELTFSEVIQAMETLGHRNTRSGQTNILAEILENSPNSSTFTNKLIALKNYSVINQNGTFFELTLIGNGIAFAKSTNEKADSIKKAFTSHPVLGAVWEAMHGRNLEPDYIPNVMVQVGGVQPEKKNKWADYFIEAIKDAKLTKITPDGKEVVLSDISSEPESPVLSSTPKIFIDPNVFMKGNAETLEKLSSALTGGTKLQHRSGDCYVLVYLNGSLGEVEFDRLKKILNAGASLLETFVTKETGGAQ